MKSILDIPVSCFKNCLTADNSQPVNLLKWLTTDKYKAKVEQIRNIKDKAERDALKKTLPAITPSGTFGHRELDGLLNHSGLIAFDIDFKDNQHITNYADLKAQLQKLQNVAYCGLSVSGAGYWGLIPISNPDKHREHFLALIQDFKRWGIILDKSGADVCRLRIASFDPEAHFNHAARPYTKLYIPQPSPPPKYNTTATGDTGAKVEKIMAEIAFNKVDITGAYDQWLKLAAALAHEFGEGGRQYFHTVSMFHSKYTSKDADRMFDGVLKHNYNKVTIASFFHIADEYGIRLKPDLPTLQPITPATTKKQLKATPAPVTTGKSKPWDQDIADLEQFFAMVPLPAAPIRLDQCSQITDIPLFIQSHMQIVRAQNGNKRYLPYLERLQALKTIIRN